FHPISQFHPHLTVAYRDLTFENFKKAWEEYEKKTFEDSFLVDKICLFKHDSQKWNLLSIKKLE
ncbi:MAG: RNA 2',3'-cyclic phosphodiesterase, partial [Kaistella sp.]